MDEWRGEISTISRIARMKIGKCLRTLQEGGRLEMPLSRPMPSIAESVHELRIADRMHNWRLIYRIDPDAIIVLSVFSKKSGKTPKREIENARRRMKMYKEISQNR